MARLLPTVVVVALLGATAAAFAITEGLKLEPSPISLTRVDKVFSPTCECGKDVAAIAFRLRRADRVTVTVDGGAGNTYATLAERERLVRGWHEFLWDGRGPGGAVAPDGTYLVHVHLALRHRTIVLPNPLRIDTTAPTITLSAARPSVFSPDGDGRADKVKVRYVVSEPAHAILYADGRLAVRGRFERRKDKLEWYGTIRGSSVGAGRHRLTLTARDIAGNLSEPTSGATVRIRYVSLARHRYRARPGALLRVLVDADARRVSWRIGARHGVAARGAFTARAPQQAGRYVLLVSAAGHSARAVVVVAP